MADGTTPNYAFVQPEVGASAGTWGGKLNQNWEDVDADLADIEDSKLDALGGLAETIAAKSVATATIVANAVTLNLAVANAFDVTVDDDVTFTFANAPAGADQVVAFLLRLSGAGAQAITWPASVSWHEGTEPTWQSIAEDLVVFVTFDAGTTWYARRVWTAT